MSATFEYDAFTESTWITSYGMNLITVDDQELEKEQSLELQHGAVIQVHNADFTRTIIYQLIDAPNTV